jgi:hypothetical protein
MTWLSVGALLGCTSLQEYLPPNPSSLPNADAVDRALTLCSLTHGSEPFHLKMLISPPERASSTGVLSAGAMQAEIELWWLNAITYRTEIRSAAFRQIHIVNGNVIQEQNLGSFYPRWIQNFADALLDPVPHADKLRKEPGSIPLSQESHACISRHDGSGDETALAQICFQGSQPLLASDISFSSYVAFDDFRAFGEQLIPRTLINDLPANLLVRGQILLLEPMLQSAYPLLKATRFTPLTQQIRTRLLSKADAEVLLDRTGAESLRSSLSPAQSLKKLASYPSHRNSFEEKAQAETTNSGSKADPVTVYVRTDRTGRVREAYTDRNDVYNQHQTTVARAMQLRFRPLLINGAPQQIEAPVEIR